MLWTARAGLAAGNRQHGAGRFPSHASEDGGNVGKGAGVERRSVRGLARLRQRAGAVPAPGSAPARTRNQGPRAFRAACAWVDAIAARLVVRLGITRPSRGREVEERP